MYSHNKQGPNETSKVLPLVKKAYLVLLFSNPPLLLLLTVSMQTYWSGFLLRISCDGLSSRCSSPPRKQKFLPKKKRQFFVRQLEMNILVFLTPKGILFRFRYYSSFLGICSNATLRELSKHRLTRALQFARKRPSFWSKKLGAKVSCFFMERKIPQSS